MEKLSIKKISYALYICIVLVGFDLKAAFQEFRARKLFHRPESIEPSIPALHKAVDDNDLVRVKALIDRGAFIDELSTVGELELIESLGNDNSLRGNRPMHFAKSAEMVRLLVSLHANLELQNLHGKTPLHSSVEKINASCVRALISAGANIEAMDDNMQTPLHLAARKCKLAKIDQSNASIEITQDLLVHGANMYATSVSNLTPLDYGIKYNNKKFVKAFIAAGYDVAKIDFTKLRGEQGARHLQEVEDLLEWYTPERIDKENSLLGQSIEFAHDQYKKGKPWLLGAMLGLGKNSSLESLVHRNISDRSRSHFEPSYLEGQIIPALKKQMPN
ncbi:MAG: ankyrin repeat domain-containing protein [Candidatus Dependentiae bacterium]|nr:ankyrin repeat domain-containing protein [Candidatus Dependentiae bacterium]